MTRTLETKVRVSDDPLVYLLDTPGIMLPNIRNLETGMKLAACGKFKAFFFPTKDLKMASFTSLNPPPINT